MKKSDEKFKDDLLETAKKNKSILQSKKSYGFGYIYIFKIISFLLSVFIAFILLVTLNMLDGTSSPQTLTIILSILGGLLSYVLLILQIKLFENIAIIARNSTDIRDKLND